MASPFPLPIAYGHTDAVKNSGGFLVNLEAEAAPQDARTPVTLRGSPGYDMFTDMVDAVTGLSEPGLCCIEVDGAGYAITRKGLFRVFSDGGYFQLATFALSTRARCETNGLVIVAVDGTKTWSYTIRADEQSRYDNHTAFADFGVDLSNAANYYASNTVSFLDGYLVYDRATTNQFFNTEAYSTTVDPLAFSQAEANPDDVVGCIADHQILTVMGTKSMEFWFDAGVGESPFARVDGGVVEHGLISAYALAKNKNNIFLLAPEGVVYAVQGYQPRPISTPAVEDELRPRDLTTATGYCYDDAGHPYYVLNVEASGDYPAITLVYDLSTNLWHRRRHPTYGRLPIAGTMLVFGKVLGVSYIDGKIYEIGPEFYDLDGDPLIAEIVTGPMPTAGEYADFNLFEIEVDGGVGNAACPEPQIGMEISDDDGKTFGNQRLQPLGALGKYKNKVRWRRNGSSYFRRYRVTLSDPVRRSMTSVALIE